MEHEESTLLRHEACPKCPSSDAFAVYSTGWGHCFSCGCNVKRTEGDYEEAPPSRSYSKDATVEWAEGDFQDLPARGINKATCQKYGYRVGTYHGKKVHIAPLYKEGQLVAQKLRDKDKNFSVVGNGKNMPLFGMNLISGGKMLVVTEGEIDAMSVAQAQDLKFPAVSLPNGATAAAKCFANHLEYLAGFDKVIILFDMDEPGRKAAQEAAEALPPGKAYIAYLPLKDANECLQAGKVSDIINAIWTAKPFRPDGIVGIEDIEDELFREVTQGIPWVFPALTKHTFGRRYGELYGFGAGVGIGKTDVFTQQIADDITTLNEAVGVIYLEQPVQETVQRVAGKIKARQFHIPDAGWTKEEYREAVGELKAANKLWLYRHFGQMDWETIKGKIRYFNKALGIRHIYLDHLTALIAGEEDERRALDKIMSEMASLAQELGIIIHFISHLTTPQGKSHEEGGRVEERHFTGSRAIARWAHYLFGLERNKQAEDPVERSTTTFRILKDRYTGRASGETFFLRYNKDTGHLYEVDAYDEGPSNSQPMEF